MKLRPYQQRCLDELYEWFRTHDEGNPVIELCTGSGKSHILAAICKDAVDKYQSRVLVITHVKELVEQDYEKIVAHGVNDVGIYSSGVGRRDTNHMVLVAGIQSIYKRANELGAFGLIIIDEAHIPNHKEEGIYRKFLEDSKRLNPNVRVLGLTGSPWRLGHGYIHENSTLFHDLIRPVGIKELIDDGYICKLQSKFTNLQLDTNGIGKRGGEYIESELQKKLNVDKYNYPAVEEIIKHGQDRRCWLVFCTGVSHSITIRDMIRQAGYSCETVTGETPKKERERILNDFKSGAIRCVTNCSVLTTGFDNPMIDLLAMLRPTMSPTLYTQIIGRSLRIHPEKNDAKILDFAGNISVHGPITDVRPPKKKGEKVGEAPVKVCENCQEIVHISAKVCPACGTEFPPPPKERTVLHQDDIMGIDKVTVMEVKSWKFSKHTSKKTGNDMIKVTYYGKDLSSEPVKQYFPIYNQGYAGDKARLRLYELLVKANVDTALMSLDVSDISKGANLGRPPKYVKYEKNGMFFNVIGAEYET